VLVADETILRLFPPLRQAWGVRGRQVCVPVTGRNDRRVLFGAINVRTGHRVLRRAASMRQGEVHAFLRELRSRYRAARRVWLLLDRHGSHGSAATCRLAAGLRVELLFLPKQCPELNPMDHLWRLAKKDVVANRQYGDVDDEAEAAEHWLLALTPREARRKAGMLSKNFWLLT
jgi:transposase